MIVCRTLRAGPPVLQQWRRQLGSHRRREHVPRDLVALTYLVQGSPPDGLLDLQRLTICVLHDVRGPTGSTTIRFAGYRASVAPGGIALGGTKLIRFEKDLAQPPLRRSHGCRFGLERSELLPLALQMERRLQRHSRYPFFPRRSRLRLPQFWVALAMNDPLGAGPEFEMHCRETGWTPDRPLVEWQRDYLGQALFPLEFVGHLWRRFQKVYVELRTLRRSQVLRMKSLDELVGSQVACQYDLLHSRFPAQVD